MKRYFLIVLMAVLPSLTWADWTGEIAGVKPGMSVEEAKAAVQKANPRFVIDDKKATDGTLWGFVALDVTGDAKRWGADYVVTAFDHGKVWYVGRRQIFPEGGRPTVKSFFGALEEKYGKFNVFSDTGRDKTYQDIKASGQLRSGKYAGAWWFDRAGTPDERACMVKNFEVLTEVPRHAKMAGNDPFLQSVYARLVTVQGSAFGLPNQVSGSCGRRGQFYVSTGPDGNFAGQPEFIGSVSVWVSDMTAQYDRAMAQKTAAETAKKEAMSAELSKGVKPSF